ncbi:MAG: glyoxalase/bleomycin resistance/extradiol dioxygenase family protein [Desulfobulbaceae bacterium A2]|nr:MAG: glyoxalase/bleomycin resistance/extradiol dioxygenase family protein [Desulfobulbaceae bacterium A2]
MVTSRQVNMIDFVEFPVRSLEDLAASKAFFAQVFDWPYQDWGDDYADTVHSGLASGLNADSAHRSEQPLVVVFVSDLPAARRRVLAAGGSITREIFAFPGGQRFHFREPGGNELAVWSECQAD